MSLFGGVLSNATNEAVRRFDDATARSAAIPSPSTGLLTVLTNSVTGIDIYNGSAWVPLSASQGQWTSYTPTWTTSNSSAGLSVGTGGVPVLTGKYRMIAPYTMAWRMNFHWGATGGSGGTGFYYFSTPSGYTMPDTVGTSQVGPARIQNGLGAAFTGSTFLTSGQRVIAACGYATSATGPVSASFCGYNVDGAGTQIPTNFYPDGFLWLSAIFETDQQW